MPASTRKRAKPVTVEPSAQSETTKSKAGRKKAPKDNAAPSDSAEGIPPIVVPAAIQPSPKKRGRKPRRVATDTSNLLPQNVDGPVDPIGKTVNRSGIKPMGPVPACDPLPAREGRNTHPGLRDGVQPTPRRSSQEAQAERDRKRLKLEAEARAINEAIQRLAQVELDDERRQKELEDEGHQQLFRPNRQQCHETTACAAQLEQGVLVTLRWIKFSGLRGELVSQHGVALVAATLPRVKGQRGSIHVEA